jgi:S-adenosylmethionine hydrolase
MRFRTISFLSDYGLVDEFVGVVKSVIRTIAPDVVVIDITHDIAPHDVRGGGLALARATPYLAPGVVIAIVDPGVGSARRAVAVEVGGGASVLVGPDNGVLAPAVALCGGATAAVVLDRPEYQLDTEGVGATFAGRDVFAPVAAHLCTGAPLGAVGTPVAPDSLTPALVPVARVEPDAIVAEVLWVDRFGNAQLNLDPDDVAAFGDDVRLRIRDDLRRASRVHTFADVRAGEVGLVTDSSGLVALCVDRGSAASELRLEPGDEVRLERDSATVDNAVPLSLRPRGGWR